MPVSNRQPPPVSVPHRKSVWMCLGVLDVQPVPEDSEPQQAAATVESSGAESDWLVHWTPLFLRGVRGNRRQRLSNRRLVVGDWSVNSDALEYNHALDCLCGFDEHHAHRWHVMLRRAVANHPPARSCRPISPRRLNRLILDTHHSRSRRSLGRCCTVSCRSCFPIPACARASRADAARCLCRCCAAPVRSSR